jgi:hypothetical protein
MTLPAQTCPGNVSVTYGQDQQHVDVGSPLNQIAPHPRPQALYHGVNYFREIEQHWGHSPVVSTHPDAGDITCSVLPCLRWLWPEFS